MELIRPDRRRANAELWCDPYENGFCRLVRVHRDGTGIGCTRARSLPVIEVILDVLQDVDVGRAFQVHHSSRGVELRAVTTPEAAGDARGRAGDLTATRDRLRQFDVAWMHGHYS